MLNKKREYYLKRKFGITEQQYDDLYNAQQGCCAVCKRPASGFRNRLAVDHDHTSLEVRGLLCFNCNKYVVGRHRREAGLELLKAAVRYLDREYTGWIVPPKPKRKKRRCKKQRKT